MAWRHSILTDGGVHYSGVLPFFVNLQRAQCGEALLAYRTDVRVDLQVPADVFHEETHVAELHAAHAAFQSETKYF